MDRLLLFTVPSTPELNKRVENVLAANHYLFDVMDCPDGMAEVYGFPFIRDVESQLSFYGTGGIKFYIEKKRNGDSVRLNEI